MIILASSSKNRITALTLAGYPFTAVAADIDEKAIQHEDRNIRQIRVAQGKVDKVATTHQGFIVGADGVNIVNGQVLEKPVDKADAKRMLLLQSGRRCSFLTGYYMLNTQTGKTYQGTSETYYTFRTLDEAEIDDYLNTEPVFTWAAAFSPSNSKAVSFVTTVEGSYTNFNYSLPLDQLVPIFQSERVI